MNPFYAEYIATARHLAKERGLDWDVVCDDAGKVSKDSRWDLTELVGMLPPPTHWLGQLGADPIAVQKLNEIRQTRNQEPIALGPMPQHWRDLYQAVFVHKLLIGKTKPQSAMQIARGIRRLAPAAGDAPPWAITPEHIQLAYNAVLRSANSGKLALDFVTMVKTIIDGQKLADIPALARFCVPYPTSQSLSAQRQAETLRKRQNAHGGKEGLRRSLATRKTAAKLPEERAFWELARIVFTETPRSFSDAIRFAVFKVQIIMGFRIGEAACLPLDWKRWREYLDADGRAAGARGGFSRSLMIRHFAEKQEEDAHAEIQSFYEHTQHVPPMFEEILIDTLDHVEKITAPLRERLRRQTETRRIFPEYPEEALVPAWEMYVRMTGNIAFSDHDIPLPLVQNYRETLGIEELDKIRQYQLGGRHRMLAAFWGAAARRDIPIRKRWGNPIHGRVADWRSVCVRVGDVERHVRANRTTKLSDTMPTTTTDGTLLYPHELMFIMPARNVVEGRNNGVLDIALYCAIGRIDRNTLIGSTSGRGSGDTLFERYGMTAEDRALRLTPHSLRHLQNAELFRLGVADTIITKKFNRRSVQQSHAYDHRSLAEDLADIDLVPEAEDRLGDKALQVFKLISANKARGHVVEEFGRVQREHGEAAAFDYLNAEADGLHVTPYGLCINSFTSDPCPRHLECFNGCLHLARTDVVSEQENLERMRDRFAKVIATLEALPADRRTAGWANQTSHARIRHENVVRALDTAPGMRAFPDGNDLFAAFEPKAGATIIDTMKRSRQADD